MSGRLYPARLSFSLFCCGLCLLLSAAAGEIPGLTVLEHAGVTLGIKLDAGGRPVLLRRTAEDGTPGENMLYCPPELWTQTPPAADIMTANDWTSWRPFQGHIIWIGPQNMFWSRQNVLPQKREQNDEWPPDPYIVYGRFTVAEQSSRRLVIDGPESRVSGIKLRKEFSIEDDGKIRLTAAAVNITDSDLTLNLWSNTRVSSSRRSYVKIPNQRITFTFGTWEPYQCRMLPWSVDNGWFHFLSFPVSALPAGIKEMSGKMFMNPPEGIIAVFGSDCVFLKTFKPVSDKELAPGQGAVEVYHCISQDPTRDIAELEFYSPFTRLAPGDTAVISETWELRPYSGPDTPAANLQWLDNN